MANVSFEPKQFFFEANNRQYEIESGLLNTQHLPNNAVNWTWHIDLQLKKSDVIPMNKKVALLWEDRTVFVWCIVIGRSKKNGLDRLLLVPYFEGETL